MTAFVFQTNLVNLICAANSYSKSDSEKSVVALAHLTGTKPTGGKLKGDEFQRVKKVLAGTGQPVVSGSVPAAGKFRTLGTNASPPLPKTPPPPM